MMTTAIQRNPQLSSSRASKCDSGLHEYKIFKFQNGTTTMACQWCGFRKGGLEPLIFSKTPLVRGVSHAKGTLTAKKSE